MNAQSAKKSAQPRKSKATRWRAAVLVGVHVFAAIHIAHWLSTGRTVSPLEPSEAMEFAKYSVVNAGLIFFALTILSTLLLGRWFCGWACHVVALQDLSRAFLLKIGIRPRPLRSRWMALLPILAAFYMFLWPLVYRLYIQDPLAVRDIELSKAGFWDTFPTWGPALLTFFVAGFVAVYFLGAKGFCTYACPYGAVFGVMDRVAPGRIRVTDACKECGHCTLTCTSNVDVSREVHDYGMVVDPGCMKCMDCVSVCPENALYFGLGKPAILAKPRQEKRPARKPLPLLEEVTGTSAALFGYFAVRGFEQERGFLLSVGIAACFAFLMILALRLVQRKDVKLPGLVLKEGGRARPLGVFLAIGILGLAACAVPFGIVPEVSTWRASAAWNKLGAARGRWFEPERQGLSATEREAAEVLLANAKTVRARSRSHSLGNTERLMWGELLLGNVPAFEQHISEALLYPRAGVGIMTLSADELRSRGELDRAEAAYRTVLDAHPNQLRAALHLAQMLDGQGDRAAAAAVIDATLEAMPANVAESVPAAASSAASSAGATDRGRLLAQRAIIRFNQSNTEGAVDDLRAALASDPQLPAVRDTLWRVLMDTERSGEAVQVLRAGIALDGSSLELRAHLTQVLLVTGQRDEAVQEAVELGSLAEGDERLMKVVIAVLTQAGAKDELEALTK